MALWTSWTLLRGSSELFWDCKKMRAIFSEDMISVKEMVDKLQEEHPGGMFPGQLNIPHFSHPLLAKLCLNTTLLDTMELLLGPNLVLLSANIFAKYPTKE